LGEAEEEIAGLLYIDGRVRVYQGSKTKLPKKYVSRQKLCLRGMSDYWVNDAIGRPYFVVSSAHNKGLLSMLKTEIVPQLLKDVPNQATKEDLNKDREISRFSLIFDREGYSPEFFKDMWKEHRISCYTYKKYVKEDWSEEEFKEHEVKLKTGKILRMKLAEKKIMLKGIEVREIRKLTEIGHQTSIITTDFIPEITVIAANMFARWSQENFFKYMREHFGIDRLIEYGVEEINDTVEVLNPEYRTIESQVKSTRQKIVKKEAEFGRISLNLEEKDIKKEDTEKDIEEKEDEELKKYLDKKSKIQESIEFYKNDLNTLKDKRKSTEKYIKISELPKSERYDSLMTEKKHIMDTIKMIAYRAETAMSTIIEPQMFKRKEARTLLRQIFCTEIDLDPDIDNKVLNISLHSLSNERSNKIVLKLCKHLNESEATFPGTDMRLFYKLVS